MPSAAFAAQPNLSLIPEGEQGVVSVDSQTEGGDDDAFSHCASSEALSVDGGDAALSSENVTEASFVGDGVDSDAVVAQAESIKSFFLARTLESTRTIPMVSASLPLGDCPEEDGALPASSMVVGSFEEFGMTFAFEAGGESVALVAADYAKLPAEFIEKQVIVIPDAVTPNDVDRYSVTRIANHAFAGFTKENADPSYTGCSGLVPDGVQPEEADADQSEEPASMLSETVQENDGESVLSFSLQESDAIEETPSYPRENRTVRLSSGESNDVRTIVSIDEDIATFDDGSTCELADSLVGCVGILAMSVPASVSVIEDEAFAGFETLQYLLTADAWFQKEAMLSSDAPQLLQANDEFSSPLETRNTMSTGYYALSYMSNGQATRTYGPYASRITHAVFHRKSNPDKAGKYYYYVSFGDSSVTATNRFFMLTITGSATTSFVWGTYFSDTGYEDSWFLYEFTSAKLNQAVELPVTSDHFYYTDNPAKAGFPKPLPAQVTWESSGGLPSSIATEVALGSKAVAPNQLEVTKTGYMLEGWYENQDLTQGRISPDSETGPIEKDTTFYAKWTPITYTVNLNANGGSVSPPTMSRTYDDGVALPTATRAGYTLSAWTTESDGSGSSYGANSTANLTTEDCAVVNLYAQWGGTSVALTWNPHNGTASSTESQTYGTPLKLPTQPTYIGHTFIGWFTDPDAGTQVVAGGKIPLEATTYHARWKETQYTVVFSKGDGTFASSWSQPTTTFAYESGKVAAPTSAQLARHGYTLVGWSTSSNPPNAETVATGKGSVTQGGTTTVSSLYAGATSIPSPITLYPVWRLDAYKITLAPGIGSYDTAALTSKLAQDASGKAGLAGNVATYTVLTPTFVIPSAKCTGSTFEGWSKDGGVTKIPTVSIDPAITLENATYTAFWSKNTYLVRYYLDDATAGKEASFAPGASTVSSFDVSGPATMVIPDPVRPGYDFTGWSGPGLVGSSNKGGASVNLASLITDALPKSPAIALSYVAHWEKRDFYAVAYILNDEGDKYLASFASTYAGLGGEAPVRQSDGRYMDRYRFDETGQAAVLVLPCKSGEAPDVVRPGYAFAGWTRVDDGTESSMESIDPKIMAEDLVLKARWTPVVATTLPVSVPDSILFLIDTATGKTQENVEGFAPESIKFSSTTPVDCTLSVKKEDGSFGIAELFEKWGGASPSAVDDLVSSLGLLFSFDGTGLAANAAESVGLLLDGDKESEVALTIQGSERYAGNDPRTLCSVDVGMTLKLAQKVEDVFKDVAIDLSRVRIKTPDELPKETLDVANIIWTVSL